MTLENFRKEYDKENAIVLLEGKRNVLKEDKEKLVELGKLLASKTKHMIFRSGNASGSDEYFSKGVSIINHKRLQVITPYTNHRAKKNVAYDIKSLDDINLAQEDEVVYQSKNNKKTEYLIDKYVAGDKNRYTIKAAYIIRDTIKALGTKDIAPATFGIFYDDLENPMEGGTGHTMKICQQNNIPILDQTTWMQWLTKQQELF